MRRPCMALAVMCIAGGAFAQEAPSYTPSDNPFQGDYHFAAGQPITFHIDLVGVHLDDLTVKALDEPPKDGRINCDVTLTGSGAADHKTELTVVLLFEDANRSGIERISLEAFKVKKEKSFHETQRMSIGVDTMNAAKRVYIFVQAAT